MTQNEMHNAAQGKLRDIKHALECLSDAMAALGMMRAVTTVDGCLCALDRAYGLHRDAFSSMVFDMVKRSEESSRNMLDAALAGISLGEREKERTK